MTDHKEEMSAPVAENSDGLADLTPLEAAIVRTVTYVDIFDFPLTAAEVHRYLVGISASPDHVETALANGRLVPHRLDCREGYFTLRGRSEIVPTRRQRARAAQQLWPVALRYGRLIAGLPFVRMVAVTGSLAVDNADPNADIDYLVITENGRVWLARALTILLVRRAARDGITLCPNYFLAERALHFQDHNLYTAREIVQMVPIAGIEMYHHLRQQNIWTAKFLPNAHDMPDHIATINPTGSPGTAHEGGNGRGTAYLRHFVELLLRSKMGGWLEEWEMNRKIRKFGRVQENAAEAAFCPDWCKGHFHDHARRILESYQQRLEGHPNRRD